MHCHRKLVKSDISIDSIGESYLRKEKVIDKSYQTSAILDLSSYAL
ncbi:hypothetical protein VCR31J2_1270759 [Vibrio coralliirubri]|uniref:Uncharacterized protein n=1 Tax=Vibrio coralliirubri TaxID=1516159 RepID=A0AA86XPH8_9VIBR|nr:hypothetical protein VCR31J2_1270759 [Vibrio coralliirubri]